MSEPLATDSDLEARLGRDLTEAEAERTPALLADVSDSVRIYTGQALLRGDVTVRARVKRGMVRLPQRPVHSVDSVTNLDGDDVDFEWDGLDRVHISHVAAWESTPAHVVNITYDAGPDEVSSAIVGIVCSIVLRSLGVDPTQTSVSQESVDGYAYTLGSAGGAGAYGLLPSEMRTLDSFRRNIGSIQVAL